ncbi:PTCHD3 [Cordylochernes scorpioides]|uniref:PTCHD3 n=1 Tax=Cordylochernes scorpioides TaxID=51811 RepID=A0ABY6KJ21_9ARAC|nr:PTCHD3 [Cordylochernes scorpioides]
MGTRNKEFPLMCLFPEWLRCFNVEEILTKALGNLGYSVGKRPWHYALGTLSIFFLLSLGLLKMNFRVRTFDIIAPFEGRSIKNRARIEELFGKENCKDVDLGRLTRFDRFGRIFIESADGRSVLRSDVFRVVQDIDQRIKNMTIVYDGKKLQYKDICAKEKGQCFFNPFFKYVYKIKEIESGIYKLKFPFIADVQTARITFTPLFLGGVTTEKDSNIIKSAKAISLIYILDFDDPNTDIRNELWEFAFLDLMGKLEYPHLNLYYITPDSFSYEGSRSVLRILPSFTVAAFFLMLFSVASNLSSDCVVSKPWLALAGIMVGVIGNAASFGFCQLIGIPCFLLNFAVGLVIFGHCNIFQSYCFNPDIHAKRYNFLKFCLHECRYIPSYVNPMVVVVSGMVMDDAFVVLAAWRLTDPRSEVPVRMRRTYEQVGIAITLTSLTNALAFLIGAFTPSLIAKMICSYALGSILACYVATLTFLGAVLALTGRAEMDGLSGFDLRTPAMSWQESGTYLSFLRYL